MTVRLHGPWFLNGTVLGAAHDDAYHARVRAEGARIPPPTPSRPPRATSSSGPGVYGLPLPDAEVIYGTVPAVPAERRWRPEECDPGAILFVGRFDRHKGGDLIIEAFGRVLRRVPDARLWYVGADRGLAGDDGRTWTIEAFIRDRVPGALEAGRIRWLGPRPQAELDRLRRTALATVVCSRYETFSSATAESMTMGCPTIAAKVGGIAEIIEDGVDGLLHRPEDPDDLADRIVSLLEGPGRAASSAAGRRRPASGGSIRKCRRPGGSTSTAAPSGGAGPAGRRRIPQPPGGIAGKAGRSRIRGGVPPGRAAGPRWPDAPHTDIPGPSQPP